MACACVICLRVHARACMCLHVPACVIPSEENGSIVPGISAVGLGWYWQCWVYTKDIWKRCKHIKRKQLHSCSSTHINEKCLLCVLNFSFLHFISHSFKTLLQYMWIQLSLIVVQVCVSIVWIIPRCRMSMTSFLTRCSCDDSIMRLWYGSCWV
jgi:hypothetical protein